MANATTRRAVLEDIEILLDAGYLLFQESRYRSMRFSVERLAATLTMCIKDGFCEVAIDEGGDIVGFMFGLSVQPYFSDEVQAVELACYALPAFRGEGVCHDMVRHFTDWAARIGATECCVGSSAAINSEAARRFYAKHGFEPVGDLMVRGVDKCAQG